MRWSVLIHPDGGKFKKLINMTKIYNWFGYNILESLEIVPKYTYDNMVKYLNDFYEKNKNLDSTYNLQSHGEVKNEFHYIMNSVFQKSINYINSIGGNREDIEIYVQRCYGKRIDKSTASEFYGYKHSHFSSIYILKKEQGFGGEIEFRDNDNFSKKLPFTVDEDKSSVWYDMPEGTLLIFPSHLKYKIHEYTGEEYMHLLLFDVQICASLNNVSNKIISDNFFPSPKNWVKGPFFID